MSKQKIIIEEDELIKYYITDNMTVNEIAKLLNISTASVNRFLKLYGIKKDPALKNKKIATTINSRTPEEKIAYNKKISTARSGKGTGNIPWNKGKHTGNCWSGKHHTDESKQKISQTKQNKSDEEKQAIEEKRLASRIYTAPWNKGISTGSWDESKKQEILAKQYVTKKQNNSFNSSKPENRYYEYLIAKYSQEDIISQYSVDPRYPFVCDFYIKSIDTFIELNLHWSHGGHLFNKDNIQDINKLAIWQEKATTSDFYKNAIETWTVRDPQKMEYAKANNLNYICFYSEEELYND